MTQLTIGGGLNNLGNTCFFNATLQTLSTFLAHRRHSQNCHLKQHNQWCAFCEMESIFLRTRQVKSFSPSSMISHLKSIFKKFKLGRQEDSHEFLRYLVEGMQDSQTGKLGKDRDSNERKIKNTHIFDIFGGIIKTCIDCLNCKFKSVTTERYYDFNIDKECQRSNTLLQGISSFFAVDKLEGNNKYLCEHCKALSNARKMFLLDSVPQIATIQLKRFTNSMRKIGKFIQYPLTIDLGKHLLQPHKALMKLYAIVVHAGGSSYSGHYYAFVRVGETWYKMDDSYVSKVSVETALNQNAYLLFYEKIFQEEKALKKKQTENVNNKTIIKEVNGINGIKNDHSKEQSSTNYSKPTLTNQKPLSTNKFQTNITTNKSLAIQKPKQIEKSFQLPKQLVETDNQHNNTEMMQQVDQDLEVPCKLKRTKSKQQMQKQIPVQELILRTIDQILSLKSKINYPCPRNRSQRHIYQLRQYETVMQKRRKIG